MPTIKLTADDIKAGTIVTKPGWFGFEIGETREKPSKGDGSLVYTVALRVLEGPDEDMIGALVFKAYSEKQLWRVKKFFGALGADITTPGVSLSFDDAKGMKIRGYLVRGKNTENGEDINEISDFRAYDAA